MVNIDNISPEEPLKFKFRFVDANGRLQGFLSSSKGSFDGNVITLGNNQVQIPVEQIVNVARKKNRLGITSTSSSNTSHLFAIEVYRIKADELQSILNIFASRNKAERHRAMLDSKGHGFEFSTRTCPHCQSIIDMTRRDETPQIYCEYCFTLSTLQAGAPSSETQYCLCEHCGLYAKINSYTIFYFVFLFVVFFVRSHEKTSCKICIRNEAWSMLFGNLIFILGVPFAIVQLIRAYGGGGKRGHPLARLDKANSLLIRKKYEAASDVYEQICENTEYSAGVRYNHGLALAGAEQYEAAAMQFELALQACSNYYPAAEALAGCYKELGMDQEFEDLTQQWSNDSQDVEQQEASEPLAAAD